MLGYHADERDGGDPGVEGRDRDHADAVTGRVEGDQPGLRVLVLEVLHHLGRPVRLVHVVAVPTVVAVEGVAARPAITSW